ncbi:MAG TPA: alpha/beta hydrolase [Actinomycetes bacterium]|nr:alpha/beta hydrolase [Actinomycetes bacterium]
MTQVLRNVGFWHKLGLGLACAALVTAYVIGSSSPAAAHASAPSHEHLPTIVLVHGAFADASGWNAEVAELQHKGYPVIAPADPLRGLTADADYIRSILKTIDGPVVLVGHSYGGAVITNAARGATNVVALVYVAAFIPDEGTSVATSYDPTLYPGSLLAPNALDVRPVPNPAAPGGIDQDLTIKPALFRQIFAGDQPAQTAAVMAATQRPLSAFAYTEPSGAPAWKTIPSWDLLTLDDRAISPGGQQFMADRAGARITTIHSAHDVMVSHPQAVVNLIVKAACATSS